MATIEVLCKCGSTSSASAEYWYNTKGLGCTVNCGHEVNFLKLRQLLTSHHPLDPELYQYHVDAGILFKKKYFNLIPQLPASDTITGFQGPTSAALGYTNLPSSATGDHCQIVISNGTSQFWYTKENLKTLREAAHLKLEMEIVQAIEKKIVKVAESYRGIADILAEDITSVIGDADDAESWYSSRYKQFTDKLKLYLKQKYTVNAWDWPEAKDLVDYDDLVLFQIEL